MAYRAGVHRTDGVTSIAGLLGILLLGVAFWAGLIWIAREVLRLSLS